MKKKLAIAIGLTLAFSPVVAEAQVTSSITAVSIHSSKAGQFCKSSDVGKVKRASNGKRIKCKKVNGRARWVNY
jgi:hypothetical protein